MRNKKKFNEFMNKTIEELKDEKRYGTAHVYQSTLNAFCEFCGCKIVYFHQLNRATLKEFETHLRDKQLSWNTVSTYMRTLRGAYNKAVDQKITTGNSRLFNHVYTGVKNDVKRALEVEEINKLLNEVPLKRLPEDLVRCRVWANLMFQLRGMPFVDLAFLHKSDLKGNTLSYRRHKTGGQMIVDIPPTAIFQTLFYLLFHSAHPLYHCLSPAFPFLHTAIQKPWREFPYGPLFGKHRKYSRAVP